MKLLGSQRDEAEFKLQGVTAQLEALQASMKVESAKHWEEVKKLKETEAQLLEEADKLSQVHLESMQLRCCMSEKYFDQKELHEKTLLLHSSENEKAGKEAALRGEAAGASQMAAALKAELERRYSILGDW